MTTSLTTRGELEKPHSGLVAPVSDCALRDHTTAPVLASRAFTIPVAPNEETRPSTTAGLPRGPARRRGSAVGVQRQWRLERAPPVMPSVRMSVSVAHARTIDATIDARRTPLESRPVAAAQPTRARLRTGVARVMTIIPALAME